MPDTSSSCTGTGALEEKKDVPAAIKAYSTVAQADFNYRDVQARIKRLRAASLPT
jgi:hypothetical protein